MKKIALATVTFLTLLFVSCTTNDDTAPETTVELKNEINDFVWRAMNHWYFWQSDVASLNDNKLDDIDTYYNYLNTFTDSEQLFESLKNKNLDDFSWYIKDVDEQLNDFKGISVSYGINLPRYYVNSDSNRSGIVIYISFVAKGSPADLAGIKRGDLIYKVNGEKLSESNVSLLGKIYNNLKITIGIERLENGNVVDKGEFDLTAVQISENPVHHTSIIQEKGKKIGYLVYNAFNSTYHSELNDVFGTFKNENIDELILDLRYNGGGSVLTSAYLSSMIEGSKADGSLFASLTFNNKRNEENGSNYPFYDDAALFNKETGDFENNFIPINRLMNLKRLYIITSVQTASASEMIINGLRPFMEVVTIGTTTLGKNEGSITLVDAPKSGDSEIYTNINGRKKSHTVGLQPITFQIYNSLKQNDYGDGFPANVPIDEAQYTFNILEFGDPNEVMLRTALNEISGGANKPTQTKSLLKTGKLDKLKNRKFEDEMYILPEEGSFLK